MWPRIILPGLGVPISTYHLFHVLGWFTFWWVATRWTRTRPDLGRHWAAMVVGLALCDTIGARLVFQLLHGWHSSGFFAGPLLFALFTAVYVVLTQIRADPFLDVWAIAFSMAHVFEKFACLLTGCCFGRPTATPLGVAIFRSQGNSTRYFPLPFLESMLHLLTFFALVACLRNGWFRGRLVMALGVSYGLWRGGVDSLRSGPRSPFLDGPLTLSQIICLGAIAFGLTYLIVDRGLPQRDPKVSNS